MKCSQWECVREMGGDALFWDYTLSLPFHDKSPLLSTTEWSSFQDQTLCQESAALLREISFYFINWMKKPCRAVATSILNPTAG